MGGYKKLPVYAIFLNLLFLAFTNRMANETAGYDSVCGSQFEHYLLLTVVVVVCALGIVGNTLVTAATFYR